MEERGGIEILYLEDDRALARLMQMRLQRDGFQVDVAQTGEDGLAMLDQKPYEAVIVDYRLPGMTGLDVLRKFPAQGAPPAVMVTGAGDENIAVEAMKLGCGDYVVKDVHNHYLDLMPSVLARIIRTDRILEEKRRAERELEVKTIILSATLANIDQGVSFFDENLKLVAWNERWVRFFEYPDHMVREGAPLEDFVRFNAERWEYGEGDVEALVAERLARANNPTGSRHLHARPGGHVLEIRSGPMPGGGVVTTYIDVTEQKQQEEQLRSNHELLDHVSRFQSRYIGESDPEIFFESMLMDLLRLTGAEQGFIADAVDIGGDDGLRLLARTDAVLDSLPCESVTNDPEVGDVIHCKDSLASRPFLEKRPVFADGEDAGEGTENFVGVPLWRGRGVVGVIGLADRRGGFDDELVSFLRPVFSACAQIIEGYRNQRQREEAEERIRHLATHDTLTDLPNRAMVLDHLQLALAGARRRDGMAAVLFVDLDGFKEVNDTMGHEVGDGLLKEVARRLAKSVRETDTVGRYGGDEFIIVMTDLTEPGAVNRVAAAVVSAIARRFVIGEAKISISCSIGIALYPEDGEMPDDLIKKADAAMYRVKQEGKNAFRRASVAA